ncbi:MAG: beta-N-acetylhexosaminidase [Candidatus Schekmanbacteria bacterium]|nr:beta-N-acetylhexosaminidase [Candidatus Schekmanbacteria bacterium]
MPTDIDILKQKTSRLLYIGFQGKSFEDIKDTLTQYPFGGVIFFSRNIEDLNSLKKLITEIQSFSISRWGEPLLIGIDQEGGRVNRIHRPFTMLPPDSVVGHTKSAHLAYLKGKLLGLELKLVGFNLDFYPVLDILTNPANRVIGDRSFGTDQEIVAEFGVEAIRGLKSANIASVGKHFPGHGDTREDSHEELPVLNYGLKDLLKRETIPFEKAIKEGVDFIMPAHIAFPSIDREKIPATFSSNIINGLLKKRLGFKGAVISDDLEMKAISNNHEIREASSKALNAGCDMILVCHTKQYQMETVEHLAMEIQNGNFSELEIDNSIGKIAEIKSRVTSSIAFDDSDIEEELKSRELQELRNEIESILK